MDPHGSPPTKNATDIPTRKDLEAHLAAKNPKSAKEIAQPPEKTAKATEKISPKKEVLGIAALPQGFEVLSVTDKEVIGRAPQKKVLESGLSVTDIEEIIRTAKKENVSCLKLAGLEVTFFDPQPTTVGKKAEVASLPRPERTPRDAVSQGSVVTDIPQSAEEKALHEQVSDQQLMLDNPLAWETRVTDAHLENQRVLNDDEENDRGSESPLQ